MSKLLYIFDASDWASRIVVAESARDRGYDVVIGLVGEQVIPSDFKVISLIEGKLRIWTILSLFKAINRILNQEKPNVTHIVTLKYGFLIGFSTYLSKNVQKIITLAGLGYIFRTNTAKSYALRAVLNPFLKLILLRKDTTLIFQNADDLDLMVDKRYARVKDSILIKGSGVYLDQFTPCNVSDSNPIVFMSTRLVHEKGIGVFIEAAKVLTARGVKARFQIAGGASLSNPSGISEDEMNKMIAGSPVDWLGRVSDMPALLARASLVVYPSYYGEGIPRVLLEACAAGRAIVTTDNVGCKEAVDDGVNGYLVPIKDAEATATAIEKVLSNVGLRQKMEYASREKAEAEFNIYNIAAQTVNVYDQVSHKN